MIDLLWTLLWEPAFALLAYTIPARWHLLHRLYRNPAVNLTAGGISTLLANSVGSRWRDALIGAAWAVIGMVWLWWRRHKRKRAPRAYGAKTRALLARLVKKSREAAQPRPVLRPVPQSG